VLRWFKKEKQAPEVDPDEPRDEPELDPALAAETENMVRIQQLCFIASISAEGVAHAKAEGRLEEDWAQWDLDRYKCLRADCIELADTLRDTFYRAVAINFLIEVCMKAGDLDDARALFKYQEEKHFQEQIATKYPELIRPRISEIMRDR